MLKLRKYLNFDSNWVAFIIFTIVTLVYLHPIFRNFSYWGIIDWDQTLSFGGIARKTILRYHQIPLWNPYHLGGNVLLASWGTSPSPLLPFFVFPLLLGVVHGLKIQAIAYLLSGMMGMFLLAKQLKLKGYALYLPAFVFALSSYFALHFTIGSLGFWDCMWLPWAFLYYLKAVEHRKTKYLILCSFFITLMLFSGTPYPALFAILFLALYSIVKVLKERRTSSLKIFSRVLIVALLLGAVKLLPGLEQQKEFPRLTPLRPAVLKTIKQQRYLHLAAALVSRNQALTDEKKFWRRQLLPDLLFGWRGYGAYVGLAPLILSLIGLYFGRKKYLEIIVVGFVFLLLSLGEYAPINLWKILHFLPVFNNMHIPMRFIIIFIFMVAILLGVTLSRVEEIRSKIKKAKYRTGIGILTFCFTLVVLIDLVMVSSRVFKDAFIIPPLQVQEEADFYQTYNTIRYRAPYTTFHTLFSKYDMYPAFLKNKGVVNANDPTPRPRNALVRKSPLYAGECFLLSEGRSAIVYFSPNVIKVIAETKKNNILVLNQNYDIGWKVKGIKSSKVVSTKGLASVLLTPGEYSLIFYYLPTSFIMGVIITLFAILGILLYYCKRLNEKWFKYFILLLFVVFFLYLFWGIEYVVGASPVNKPLILAKQYEWSEKYNQAAKEYEKVIQIYPYYAEGYRNLAYCYIEQKEPSKAKKNIRQAIKLQPMNWDNYNLLRDACQD